MCKNNYKDCYWFRTNNDFPEGECLKEAIEWGYAYECNKRNDCPQFKEK